MSYIPKTISEVVTEYLNRTTFLPAIQREYVWGTYGIEKLFDSIMGDYPISTFLFWKIKEENKNEWTAYEFIREFDSETPHNKEANLAGVNQDIYLVLDGQQRLTSLLIGLKGSYIIFCLISSIALSRAFSTINCFKGSTLPSATSLHIDCTIALPISLALSVEFSVCKFVIVVSFN